MNRQAPRHLLAHIFLTIASVGSADRVCASRAAKNAVGSTGAERGVYLVVAGVWREGNGEDHFVDEEDPIFVDKVSELKAEPGDVSKGLEHVYCHGGPFSVCTTSCTAKVCSSVPVQSKTSIASACASSSSSSSSHNAFRFHFFTQTMAVYLSVAGGKIR